MIVEIKVAQELSNKILISLGLEAGEASLITENLLEAELCGKKTHGLVRLLGFKRSSDAGKLNKDHLNVDIISESDSHLHINGHHKLGFPIIYKSLDLAFEKVKRNKLLCVGLKDIGVSGFIGAYARKVTECNLIFIGFNNSTGGLVPYGSIKEMWGTNPLTIGIPTNNTPVLLDMASSQITWGDLLVAKNEGRQIKEGVAIDETGNITTDPEKAMTGGLLPFAGHKGSGLAFVVELLGGALTGSRVGSNVPGGWGSFYILIDPTLFRPLQDFKKDIQTAIDELKTSPKMKGFEEIYYAGEKSQLLRQKNLESNTVELSDKLYQDLQNLLKEN